jgi:hypothetical protein
MKSKNHEEAREENGGRNMKIKGNKAVFEKNEPFIRSCWKCNGSHEHLKKVNKAHYCFECGRNWIFDRFFDEIGSEKNMVKFLKGLGLKEGESTSKIDKGYRVFCYKITVNKNR